MKRIAFKKESKALEALLLELPPGKRNDARFRFEQAIRQNKTFENAAKAAVAVVGNESDRKAALEAFTAVMAGGEPGRIRKAARAAKAELTGAGMDPVPDDSGNAAGTIPNTADDGGVRESTRSQPKKSAGKNKGNSGCLWTIAKFVGAILLLLLIIWAGSNVISYFTDDTPTQTQQAQNAQTQSEQKTQETQPDEKFRQVPDDKADYRVDAGFKDAYQKAYLDNGGNVQKAATDVILARSANNAGRSATWAYALGIWEDPNNITGLVTEDGNFLSADGIKLWKSLETVIRGSVITQVEVPAELYNSGTDSQGRFFFFEQSGIQGDRTGLKIILPSGKVVYLLLRCGNVATPSPQIITKTVTQTITEYVDRIVYIDREVPVYIEVIKEVPIEVIRYVDRTVIEYVYVPVYIHDNGTTEVGKDPSLDPARQDNAPEGNGHNQDSGPGEYVTPSNMTQPPDTSYVSPAAPTDTNSVPVGSNTESSSTTPSAETGAPSSSSPATGNSNPPGM